MIKGGNHGENRKVCETSKRVFSCDKNLSCNIRLSSSTINCRGFKLQKYIDLCVITIYHIFIIDIIFIYFITIFYDVTVW